MLKNKYTAIVLAIAALMAQNASAYVSWSEMWPWQKFYTIVAIALIVAAFKLSRN